MEESFAQTKQFLFRGLLNFTLEITWVFLGRENGETKLKIFVCIASTLSMCESSLYMITDEQSGGGGNLLNEWGWEC